jgi:hypothetical protein
MSGIVGGSDAAFASMGERTANFFSFSRVASKSVTST